jgi:hypothetical protein
MNPNSILLLGLVSMCCACALTLAVALRRNRREREDDRNRIRKLEQVIEALGDYNRYLASVKLGHHASDGEAIAHYIAEGGAEHFANQHVRIIARPSWFQGPTGLDSVTRAADFVKRFTGLKEIVDVGKTR